MKKKYFFSENSNISITVKFSELMEWGQYVATTTASIILKNKKDKVYQRQEVIDKFNICSATLWRWEKMGLIKGKRIGNRVFFAEGEVSRLLEQKGEKS
ncbi:helix-turn-helix transcriptional regulator [Sunxiuqinia elliptica]|uniref:Helix-turn-helix domain-containing protein n=1 Tax=Sunxiuqinia elliptica TaxID=655355 RepID=A0A4V3BZ72_9BACT|nr:hypothetical protein [Sunxiuqinia elliptica]TDO05439.1 hypothetical protein DET52_101799 [Sunxiuqinia elliptica]TDO64985.1 hypothetical protein DET65_1358 [Sunxiuqinia elliptica]